jgi:hypothetical protein
LIKSASAARSARSTAGHISSAFSASSGNRITPGACKMVAMVISPRTFNSFCKACIASWYERASSVLSARLRAPFAPVCSVTVAFVRPREMLSLIV